MTQTLEIERDRLGGLPGDRRAGATRTSERAPLLNRRWVRIVLGAIAPVALLVYWQVGAVTGIVPTSVFSSPAQIVTAGVNLWSRGQLQVHLFTSIVRALTGFAIGVVVGTALGYLSARVRIVDRLVDPSVQLFRAIPQSALLPLFVVWFGFTDLPKILIVVFVILPTIYIHTHTGIHNVDPKLLEVGKVFQLSRLQVAFKIVIPNALPFVFNGLRLASVSSLIILILAETLNANVGLGFLAVQATTSFRVDLVLLVVAIYAILGLIADGLLRLAQYLVTPWNRRRR